MAQRSLTLSNDRTETVKLVFALDVHAEVTGTNQEWSLATLSSTQTCTQKHISEKAQSVANRLDKLRVGDFSKRVSNSLHHSSLRAFDPTLG